MKKIIISVLLSSTFLISLNAQLKIGKNVTSINNNALLEVDSDSLGVLIPRLSLVSTNSFVPLKAHVAGMLIYNNATNGTLPNNVMPGFYYNNGLQWVRVADASNSQNIYSTDGTISGNRNVNLGNNNISFISNATSGSSHYTIDGNTFNLDALNNKIGIGVSNPSEKLQIEGNLRVSGAIMPNNLPGTKNQILSSNGANAAPSWINYVPTRSAVVAVFPKTSSSHTWCQAPYWTGTYIDLPPGKWAVNATITLNGGGALPDKSTVQWYSSWSENNLGTTFIRTTDIAGNATSYTGCAVSPSQYGFISGSIILNNMTSSTKRYYLWQFNAFAVGDPSYCSRTVLNYARGLHTEDEIVAIPMY